MRHNIRWVILALIVVASFIAYILRSNMSILGGTISEDLGLTSVQLGYIFSAFAAGYAIFQFPGGVLGTRFGGRRVIAAIALAWGALTVVTALVPDSDSASVATILGLLIVTRFLVGVFQAPFFPCVAGETIASWFPKGGWGIPNGLSSTGLTLGAAVAGPLLVWLMSTIGWRGALLVTAPAGFILAIVWWWYVRDFPGDHDSVSKKELELINEGRDDIGEDEEAEKGAWLKVLMNRDVLLLTISYFCMNFVFYWFFTWSFIYWTDILEFSNEKGGAINFVMWTFGGAVGATLGGIACDMAIKRFGLRWGPAGISATALALGGILMAIAAFSSNLYVAVAMFSLCFGLTQLTEASYWATTIAVSGRFASAAGGVLNTGGNVGGILVGVSVPLLAEATSWAVATAASAAMAVVAGVLWLFVRGDREMEQHAH